MTPGQAAYDAFRKALGTDNIEPHGLSKEVTIGSSYSVEWDRLPQFAQAAWIAAAAEAAREAKL